MQNTDDRRRPVRAKKFFLLLGLLAGLASLAFFGACLAQGMGVFHAPVGAWVLAGISAASLFVYMLGLGVGERLHQNLEADIEH